MKIYWLKQTLKDIPASLDWLHASEQKVLSSFKFPKKQNDWLLGRWTAKNTVLFCLKNDYPGLRINEVEIISADDGAPEVYHQGKLMPVLISLSHSNETGFCIISHRGINIGCDLERVEPRSAFFVKDYFTSNEQTFISSFDQKEHALWANLIWSAKESALKALRTGLHLDTRKVEVSISKGKEKNNWNALKVTQLDRQNVFYGYFKVDTEFVYTIVSKNVDIELLEIEE